MWVYACARTLKVATAQHKSNWKLTKIALKCYFEKANNEMKRNKEKKETEINWKTNMSTAIDDSIPLHSDNNSLATCHQPLATCNSKLDSIIYSIFSFFFVSFRGSFEYWLKNKWWSNYDNVIIWSRSVWCLTIIILSICIFICFRDIFHSE